MSDTLLIRNVLLQGEKRNVLIEGNRFKDLNAAASTPAQTTLEAEGLAMLASFSNAHTHAAMTVLRGYADDMNLQTWLNDHIWPYEAKMSDEAIYEGSRLAILEMLRSGTTFFADMYWRHPLTVEAVAQMGIRATIGLTLMDRLGEEAIAADFSAIEHFKDPTGGRIQLVAAPHAIYTASPELVVRASRFSEEHNLPMMMHVAETAQEVEDCVKAYGARPVKLLERLGVLNERLVIAHCVHVDDEEIALLAERGVRVAHCPTCNMKLSSGVFRAKEMIERGCKVSLGTDGASSNNNLDMRESMKFAALLAKLESGPECLPAPMAFDWASRQGAAAYGIDAGEIAVGKLADCVLVNLDNERLVPCHNLVSNIVYAADSRAIDTVLCDGKIVMREGHVPGEEEIIEAIRRVA